eukprot:12650-Heterococcus_DN1.PRE.3
MTSARTRCAQGMHAAQTLPTAASAKRILDEAEMKSGTSRSSSAVGPFTQGGSSAAAAQCAHSTLLQSYSSGSHSSSSCCCCCCSCC